MDAGDVKETSESTETSDNRDPNNEQNEGAIGGFTNPPVSSSTGKQSCKIRDLVQENFRHIHMHLFFSNFID